MKCLLVANRGEIARRVLRTARRMGLATVAVYSEVDRGALHVREADQAVALGGQTAAQTYLDIGQLIAAARVSGADAVHPGYGFLSENAEFAEAVRAAGLIWVGPPPQAMRALASKSSAKALALQLGVPVLPAYFGADQSESTLLAQAERIGYPLMVKAAAGGGGRGMRWVEDAAALPEALRRARSEAQAAFGCGELLLERGLRRPRHVEVQIFADAHGACVHLGERDCSVQRRHQKLIEESPSPAVTPALRAELGRCAVALARAAGYVGAGTAEFLLDESAPPGEEGGAGFYFMEMNTRLQVEHPVTELRTGIDLVEWQLRVARGEPLPCTQEQIRFDGHAIEVRLCAEDAHFLPQTGRVQCFVAPNADDGLRLDHAIDEGLSVSAHYDPMLGKWIAHAPTRDEAIDRLARALDDTVLLGLTSNRAFLAACLRHPVFRAGEARIPFLAEQAEALRAQCCAEPEAMQAAAAAAALDGRSAAEALASPYPRPQRWRVADLVIEGVLSERGAGWADWQAGARSLSVQIGPWGPRGARWLTVGDLGRPLWFVRLDARRVALQWGHEAFELENLSHEPPARADAGAAARELRAPFNGRVVALAARAGERVARGAAVVTIESMKIEHPLVAPADAVIERVTVEAGQQVQPGQILVIFAGSPA
ncbi:3-methylcrotonyl-CoA carboxylase alpha subunit/geranyl-CoA carboxylase alpha subunit [Tibeticola sediminis]|uniref:3-methylcrotonyl-CoA carboxylase alpha subunit/geranyl-CoA carboxylase alpha subunit n=1 Tax=Tibeticola sediminis TaxID=1917811 RepID=A0A3N4USS9_9BURK|nr:biotin carboxylase N-terminal domain-containing protein [Tibeticola sediminis]RPE73108.1 3-methylcrotonyl-CoA carboxylase alpha subunit/geranyl-CoA carboxylase alpha subunit [Tibeticola sediminis]